MAAHNILGKAGEDAAAKYLTEQGYIIRHRNWRESHLELDIVATKDHTLVVVEVKTRSEGDVQEPSEMVDRKKQKHIIRATDTYIKMFNYRGYLRFDIIILSGDAGHFQIEHIEDAFNAYQLF